jgi:hypothetical protein
VDWREGACTIKVDKANVVFSTMEQLHKLNLYK